MEVVYDEVRRHMPADVSVDVWHCKHESKGILRRWLDAWSASRHQSDVNHVTGDVHYISLLLSRKKTILTIHDCIAIDRNSGLKRLILLLFWYWLPVKRCEKIVVISEATKNRLVAHVRCDPRKIEVIHNPLAKGFRPVPKKAFPERPTLLIVGTTAHKNIERMLQSACGLSCRWIVVGRLTASQRSLFEQVNAEYVNLVNLPNDQLVEQYVRCDVVMFASTYEGFGLPIIEAQAVGRPVVTSNLWSMPEVADGAACLVNPFDIASIREGLHRVINDAEYRQDLVQKGFANVERFRATRVAERYADLYRRVAHATTRAASKSP